MTSLEIPLSDEQFATLRIMAERAGVTPEEYLRQEVVRLLSTSPEFREAAEQILNKNAELYRQLA